jgi:hypothetical protein
VLPPRCMGPKEVGKGVSRLTYSSQPFGLLRCCSVGGRGRGGVSGGGVVPPRGVWDPTGGPKVVTSTPGISVQSACCGIALFRQYRQFRSVWRKKQSPSFKS